MLAVEYGARSTVYRASPPKATDPTTVAAPEVDRPAAVIAPEAPIELVVMEDADTAEADSDEAVTAALLLRPAAVMLPLVRTLDAVSSRTVTAALLEMPAAVMLEALDKPEVPTIMPAADATPVAVRVRTVTDPAVDRDAPVTPPVVDRPEEPNTPATALTVPEAVMCWADRVAAESEPAVTVAVVEIPLVPATNPAALN